MKTLPLPIGDLTNFGTSLDLVFLILSFPAAWGLAALEIELLDRFVADKFGLKGKDWREYHKKHRQSS